MEGDPPPFCFCVGVGGESTDFYHPPPSCAVPAGRPGSPHRDRPVPHGLRTVRPSVRPLRGAGGGGGGGGEGVQRDVRRSALDQ